MTAQRVGGGGSNLLNPFGPNWSQGTGSVETVAQQVKSALFSRTPPVILDPSRFPRLKKQMRLLKKFRSKFATLLSEEEEEFPLFLAKGEMAMIDGDGQIYMGHDLLEEQEDEPGVIIGALSHEIGHQPKRWSEYRMEQTLTRDEMSAICRNEESRADAFAGLAMAEADISPEPLIAYLERVQTRPHPEYHPVDTRAAIIREAHKSRAFRREMRRRLFPDFDRVSSLKNHLGDF